MATAGVGGLYATVSLDISDAVTKLNKLDAQLKRVFTSTGTNAGTAKAKSGVDALTASTNRASTATKNAAKASGQASAANKRLGDSAKNASKGNDELAKSLKQVGNNLSTTLASFGAARSGNYFYALSSGVKGLTRGLGGATAAAGGTAAAITAIATAGIVAVGVLAAVGFGLSRLVSISNTSAASLERLRVSFEALLGSASRADRELDFLIEAAKISPYFTEDIIALDRFLLAQGLLNDELRQGLTKSLIDFGAAAGLTGDRLQDLGYALGQVYNAGRLTGDEARQLRNNFLGAEQVLRSLPRYADMTGLALKKAMEDGTISSQDFFEAFFVYTSKFGDAAAKQQQTLIGLKDTFVDVFQLGLGQANLEVAKMVQAFSPLENLKAVFRDLIAIFDQIDFRPLIASLGAVINVFVGPFTDWLRGPGQGIANFFQVTLPRAVIFFVNILRAGVTVIATFARVFGLVWMSIGRAFSSTIGVLIRGFDGTKSGLVVVSRAALIFGSTFILAMGAAAAAINVVAGLVKGLIVLLSGGGLVEAGRVASQGMLEGARVFVLSAAAIGDAWNALGSLEALSLESLLPDPEALSPELERLRNLGTEVEDMFPPSGGAGGTGGGGGGAAKAAADEAAKGMDALFDVSQRWFGLRSELERGLLGDKGFAGTVNSIASMGEKLLVALRQIAGAEGVVSMVESGTRQLMAMAEQRELVADALVAAERSLADAIRERDSFADKVRDSAIKFANAFKTEEESVRAFQLFSERGFFFETEQKKQKSFVDSLRERLAAMRKFLADVKKLKSLGLDSGLLEEIIAAGPEQAGEVAAALAEGGQALVGEVNVLQSGVTQVADELAGFGAQEFYQAGVDMAQSTVDGLSSDLGRLDAAAIAIGTAIFDAIAPWAQEMEDAGTAAGQGLADGLASGTSGIGGILDGINTDFQSSLGGLGASFASLPGSFGEGLLSGQGPLMTAVDTLFDGLSEGLDEWFDTIEEKGLLAGLALPAEFLKGLLSQYIVDPVKNWWNTNVAEPFSSFWTTFKTKASEEGVLSALAWASGLTRSGALLKVAIEFIWGRVEAWWNERIALLKLAWGIAWDWMQDAPAKAMTVVGEVVRNAINKMIGWLEGLANTAIRAINELIGAFNRIPGMPNIGGSLQPISLPRIQGAIQAGPPGPGFTAASNFTPASTPNFDVHVFIGETELTEIVDTQVAASNATYTRTLTGARRT